MASFQDEKSKRLHEYDLKLKFSVAIGVVRVFMWQRWVILIKEVAAFTMHLLYNVKLMKCASEWPLVLNHFGDWAESCHKFRPIVGYPRNMVMWSPQGKRS